MLEKVQNKLLSLLLYVLIDWSPQNPDAIKLLYFFSMLFLSFQFLQVQLRGKKDTWKSKCDLKTKRVIPEGETHRKRGGGKKQKW